LLRDQSSRSFFVAKSEGNYYCSGNNVIPWGSVKTGGALQAVPIGDEKVYCSVRSAMHEWV